MAATANQGREVVSHDQRRAESADRDSNTWLAYYQVLKCRARSHNISPRQALAASLCLSKAAQHMLCMHIDRPQQYPSDTSKTRQHGATATLLTSYENGHHSTKAAVHAIPVQQSDSKERSAQE
jgi:hypothetical protein